MRAAIAFALVLCLCGVQAISQQAPWPKYWEVRQLFLDEPEAALTRFKDCFITENSSPSQAAFNTPACQADFATCAVRLLFERVTRLIVFRALQVFYSDRPFPPEVLVAEAVAKAEARTIERCLSVAEPRTIAYVECRARDRLGFASLIMWKR